MFEGIAGRDTPWDPAYVDNLGTAERTTSAERRVSTLAQLHVHEVYLGIIIRGF